MHDHLTPVAIPPDRLARWQEAARTLGEAGIGLALELAAIRTDPSRWNLQRAAKAARFAQSATTGDLAAVANATATELEETAR